MNSTPSIYDLAFRILPAVMGALVASGIGVLVFFALRNTSMVGAGADPIAFSRFLLFATTFVITLTANSFATFLITLANGDQLARTARPLLLHVFGMTLGLFVVCAPLFLLLTPEQTLGVVRFVLPMSVLASGLLLLLHTPGQTAISASYQTITASLTIAGVTSLFFPQIIPYEAMVFFIMPLTWCLMLIMHFVAQVARSLVPGTHEV